MNRGELVLDSALEGSDLVAGAKCFYCGGTGVCHVCEGHVKSDCQCGGSGRCTHCGGTGVYMRVARLHRLA